MNRALLVQGGLFLVNFYYALQGSGVSAFFMGIGFCAMCGESYIIWKGLQRRKEEGHGEE